MRRRCGLFNFDWYGSTGLVSLRIDDEQLGWFYFATIHFWNENKRMGMSKVERNGRFISGVIAMFFSAVRGCEFK